MQIRTALRYMRKPLKPLIVFALLFAAAEITISAEAKWGCDLIVAKAR